MYWQGKQIERFSHEYQQLLDRAIEAVYTPIKWALLATRDAVLVNTKLGTDPEQTLLTRAEYRVRRFIETTKAPPPPAGESVSLKDLGRKLVHGPGKELVEAVDRYVQKTERLFDRQCVDLLRRMVRFDRDERVRTAAAATVEKLSPKAPD